MGVHYSRTCAIFLPHWRRVCSEQWLKCSRDVLLQWGTLYVGPLLGSR